MKLTKKQDSILTIILLILFVISLIYLKNSIVQAFTCIPMLVLCAVLLGSEKEV